MDVLWNILAWAMLIWGFKDHKKVLKGLLFGSVALIWFLYAPIVVPAVILSSLLLGLIIGIGMLCNRDKTTSIVSCVQHFLSDFKRQYLDEIHTVDVTAAHNND